ncbi:CRISPR-associated helicase/endonuclease Cas3 [Salinispira pacifica]|uniref:CRISPR-associated helicase Cas3 n=1 Tax=Salinispira pacifica TaxID=1307761 RepID=V5WEP9_9SPIO|nr:CRISPR-associated helicase/endonuclease Cas3 [Salinispira pacifica]AHC14004.1 CRISPR-associated helicase Cas3 [Salinispira pacifica]
MNMDFVAHVKQDNSGNWAPPHELHEHLVDVAEKAAKFASRFGNQDWAKIAGLWHDLGKYKPDFQQYIRKVSGYMNEINTEGGAGRVDHSIVGALLAKRKFGKEGENFAKILGYIIAGHHAGLPDWDHSPNIGGALSGRWTEEHHLDKALQSPIPDEFINTELPSSMPCNLVQNQEADTLMEENLHLWIRMLFSCLVDADFLDTEAYMSPDSANQRGNYALSLTKLKQNLDIYMYQLSESAEETTVNQIRKSVLSQCRERANEKPGIFTLTVPTGGGKTLSGMTFALDHAVTHKMDRVIVAIPYTSIIEQTAEQYRKVFGNGVVIEHHSNLNPDTETNRSKLASENWEAPIIVTTNVQLFESLFAARTSASRKLHNIANSVILLDEAQMIPPQYLQPIISSMRGLIKMFNCSIVLSTATQPVLSENIDAGSEVLHGFNSADVTEIIKKPEELSRQLQRVRIKIMKDGLEKTSWPEVAEAMDEFDQVLTIVNSRRDCKQLFDLLPNGTIHLSALMCPQHRSVVIRTIKDKLKANSPLRVVSTQLVEAGVDIDFPVVFRAVSGFDSIAQAAGRCNREGKLPHLGTTYIFQPERDAPPGLLRKGQYAGQDILQACPELVERLDPEVFRKYFTEFYSKLNSFDEKGIMALLAGERTRNFQFQFRSAAEKFCLIDNSEQRPIVVWYQDGEKLVEKLEFLGPNRTILRKLQRYSVSVPLPVSRKLELNNFIRPVKGMDGLYVQSATNLYSEVYGLNMDGPELSVQDYMT